MKRKKPSAVRKVIIVASSIFGIGLLAVFASVAWTLWTTSKQIAYGQAVVECDRVFRQAETQIATFKTYDVLASGKDCTAEQDELGATDYVLSAHFLVAKRSVVNEITKADLDQIAAGLPTTEYGWDVSNLLHADGLSRRVCIVASTYLDNDGKLLNQGIAGARVTYNDPQVQGPYASACGTLAIR
ncbi:hypothetical protein EYC59_06555 [Candidatus Saccharibacteria bacterium]|nr:MAG: hypothetical protein EYC59_06555 [Candidatus Saccharibacteria bacterium]